MGSIKNNINTKDIQELTEDEMNYLINLNAAKQNIAQEYDRVMSAFLHYVASSRLGYNASDDLQVEVDLTDKKRQLKIVKLPADKY